MLRGHHSELHRPRGGVQELLRLVVVSLFVFCYIYIYLYITYMCSHVSLSLSLYIYIYSIFVYRLPPLPPNSQKVGWGWTFGGPGSRGLLPASLLHLDCTGPTRAAKVGYLGLLCGRERRFQGQGGVGGAQGLTSCGALWRPSKSLIRYK